MPEEKVPRLQEQINMVEQIVHQTPLKVFVAGVVGGILCGVLSVFGMPWSVVGFGILGGCIGFCSFSVRKASDEYRKLIDNINKTDA